MMNTDWPNLAPNTTVAPPAGTVSSASLISEASSMSEVRKSSPSPIVSGPNAKMTFNAKDLIGDDSSQRRPNQVPKHRPNQRPNRRPKLNKTGATTKTENGSPNEVGAGSQMAMQTSPNTAEDDVKSKKLMFSFPLRLHGMLKEAKRKGFSHIVSWTESGTKFRINQRKAFEKEILPIYFTTSKYKSFTRQLNLYGFDRAPSGPDRGAYGHPSFVRDKVELSHTMTRVRCKRKPSAASTGRSGRKDKDASNDASKTRFTNATTNRYATKDNSSDGAAKTRSIHCVSGKQQVAINRMDLPTDMMPLMGNDCSTAPPSQPSASDLFGKNRMATTTTASTLTATATATSMQPANSISPRANPFQSQQQGFKDMSGAGFQSTDPDRRISIFNNTLPLHELQSNSRALTLSMGTDMNLYVTTGTNMGTPISMDMRMITSHGLEPTTSMDTTNHTQISNTSRDGSQRQRRDTLLNHKGRQGSDDDSSNSYFPSCDDVEDLSMGSFGDVSQTDNTTKLSSTMLSAVQSLNMPKPTGSTKLPFGPRFQIATQNMMETSTPDIVAEIQRTFGFPMALQAT